MSMHRRLLRRLIPAVMPALVVAGLSRLLAWAAPLGSLAAGLSSPQATVDRLGVDAAVTPVAGAACWAALGWLLVASLAVLCASAPGRCGRLGRTVSERTVPPALRRLLGVALGAALVTSAGAGPALAGGRAPARPAGVVLDLDWPVPAPAGGPGGPANSRAATARHSPRPLGRSAADVTVRPGDSLWSISREQLPAGAGNQAVAATWPRWYAANRSVIGADPNRLFPGQRLRPPSLPGGSS